MLVSTLTLRKTYFRWLSTMFALWLFCGWVMAEQVADVRFSDDRFGEDRHSVQVIPAIAQYKIGSHLQFIEDPHQTLTLDDFVGSYRQPMRWKSSEEEVPNFGYTRATYWFHFSLLGVNEGSKSWLLALSYSLLDQVTVYFVENESVIRSYETGDVYAFNSRPIEHRHFLFPVPNGNTESLDVYFRVQTDGTLELPLMLWEERIFWQQEQNVLLVKGVYFGIIFIMVIYNLFIYFSVRESSYLYYVCYAGFLILFQTGIDGVAFQFFWPGNPEFHGMGFVIFSAFTLTFLCLFSNSFLKLPKYNPRLSNLLLLGALSTTMAGVVAVFLPYAYAMRLVVALSLPICIGCFGVGLYTWIKGALTARYFIIAWSAFLIGILLISLSKLGWIPINFITTNALQIGSALEVVLFSLALADRINADKKDRLVAKQEAINSLKRFKSLYDNAIEGIFQCTLEGRFVSANPAMATFMGYETPKIFIDTAEDQGTQVFLDLEQYHEFRKAVLEHGQVLNYEAHGIKKDGGHFWCALSAKLVNQSLDGDAGLIGDDGLKNGSLIEGFVVDITARKKSEEQLNFLARHDPLTGLVNRREFEIRLDRAVKSAHRDHVTHTMLYMDLDQFKLVNDTCGHIAGDELLRQVTLQIQTHMRGGDTLARLGGDEFGVLLENCVGENATKVANKLRTVIQEFRFSWENKIFTLGVSIGLVPIADDTESVKAVMSLADAACYAAKDAGRNRVHEYVPGDIDLALQQGEMQWASRITQALEEGGLILYKQTIAPIADSNEGEHMEILVRLQSDDEIIAPGAFLPAAERYNLMPSVDRWVVNNVFMWLDDDDEQLANLSMCSINLSGLSIGDDEFSVFLAGIFDRYDVPPEKICFEITETIAITNLTKAIEFMNRFRALGCRFSLDDFGSGFSSYGYLKNLPVDYLKIDGCFVKDIVDDKIDYAMVESINRIGHVMGKKTIAEFVENAEILACLKTLGVDYAQGYGIARPVPVFSQDHP